MLDLAYRLCQVESANQLERCRLKGRLDLSQAHLQVLAEQRRDCPNMPNIHLQVPGILGSALDALRTLGIILAVVLCSDERALAVLRLIILLSAFGGACNELVNARVTHQTRQLDEGLCELIGRDLERLASILSTFFGLSDLAIGSSSSRIERVASKST